MGRRVRTSLPPVLGSRRGSRSAVFSGQDGAGCWASHPPGRRARSQSLTLFASGPGDAPGVLRRRLPPGRCPETYARARGANGARRSGFGRAGGPTPPGRGTGRSLGGVSLGRRRLSFVAAEFISPSSLYFCRRVSCCVPTPGHLPPVCPCRETPAVTTP